MKTISLSQEQFALVDDGDFEWLNQWKWYAHWDKYTQSYYARRSEGSLTVYMARVIMDTPKGMMCDHKNRNTLDNQRCNLRNATNSQNQMNRKTTNKSGEKCVSPNRGGYLVNIQKDGLVLFNKWYKNIEDAVQARDEQIKEIHGEYARGQS